MLYCFGCFIRFPCLIPVVQNECKNFRITCGVLVSRNTQWHIILKKKRIWNYSIISSFSGGRLLNLLKVRKKFFIPFNLISSATFRFKWKASKFRRGLNFDTQNMRIVEMAVAVDIPEALLFLKVLTLSTPKCTSPTSRVSGLRRGASSDETRVSSNGRKSFKFRVKSWHFSLFTQIVGSTYNDWTGRKANFRPRRPDWNIFSTGFVIIFSLKNHIFSI